MVRSISKKDKSVTKILIVDDSPTMRGLVQSALTKDGHTFATAEDGIDGLKKFDAFAPDIVIADINMPRLGGVEMIHAMRQQKSKKEVPIVVLTTETSSELKNKIREAGANSWVAKPFDDEVLCNLVRQMAS